VYERTDRRGIPWFGLLTAFVIGCVCFLPFPSTDDQRRAGGCGRSRAPAARPRYKLGIAILIGYAILAANRIFKLNPTTPVLDLRAASWLPAYLVGMGLIVYLSDFGPLKHPWFPLWWDMLVVAGFSLAIYLWAMRVALPAEKIERMIEGGARAEAPVLPEAA
jgi:hypothetical protein